MGELLDGADFTQLSINNHYEILAVNDKGKVWSRKGIKGKWNDITYGNKLTYVSINDKGEKFGVNEKGFIFYLEKEKWKKMDGNAITIYSNSSGKIWVTNAKHALFYKE